MTNYRVLLSGLCLAALTPLVALAGTVNVNTADAARIAAELKGIGASRAEAIVAYREQNGAFRSAEDLAAVSGVTLRIVEMNRDNIVITDKPSE